MSSFAQLADQKRKRRRKLVLRKESVVGFKLWILIVYQKGIKKRRRLKDDRKVTQDIKTLGKVTKILQSKGREEGVSS